MTEIATRPRLTLGLKTIPLKLEAYRAKIGIKSAAMEVCAPQTVHVIVPPLPPSFASPDTAPAAKKRHKYHRASALEWPPRSNLFPATELEGEPVSVEATRTYANPKAADLAARFWCRRIAFEVAALVPEPQSPAAELFAMRSRLSILNAFHRRLRRADVIAAILALFKTLDPKSDIYLERQNATRPSVEI
jgi:hypothetical protein